MGRQGWHPVAVQLIIIDVPAGAALLFFLYFRNVQGCLSLADFSWERSEICQSTAVILEIISPAAEAIMYAAALVLSAR